MRILALDTATEACSVAVRAGGREFTRTLESGRGQAERVLVMVDEVLAEAALTLRQLDGIAASVGPGAFTGVRISVSVAQGLAFGAGLPVIPVTTLEALALERLEPAHSAAASAHDPAAHEPAAHEPAAHEPAAHQPAAHEPAAHEVALACLDARMGEIYWGCYVKDRHRGVRALAPPQVSAPAALLTPPGRVLGIGRGFRAYPALAELPGLVLDEAARAALPDARAMARLGIIRLAAGEGIDPAALEPLYLRDRVALTAAERRAARRE